MFFPRVIPNPGFSVHLFATPFVITFKRSGHLPTLNQMLLLEEFLRRFEIFIPFLFSHFTIPTAFIPEFLNWSFRLDRFVFTERDSGLALVGNQELSHPPISQSPITSPMFLTFE